MDKLLMEMIATDTLPFAVVEGAGFKRVMVKAEPRYPLKTEKFFRTKKMDEIYTAVVSKIKKLLSVENAGQYIGETFLSMLNEWEIDEERVMLVLRDSGANMVKGMRLVEMPDLSCSAHILHLVINDGLSSQRVVVDILAKLKKIATHFNHSVTALQRLSKIQEELGVPRHSIIQAVQTRWNSTLHMLVRMIEQRRAITAYASDHGHFSCLSAEEWSISSNLAETLGPLEERNV
ncbi:Zinc finger BED domain-containing protein 4 [Merluccius polli]|uniref:Zinc finger BED domain-containing protein 4 n=1 Tax=Merluccius polli TaxID=89951 RepID=A0AA47MSZ8_MERPO|nr:Zinc finger BED domain-containing protein 4 [Merluccius polli]